ncbi:putative phage tail protein [Pseudobacteroides cellulosolvens]|uniref:Phage-like element pbsx protein XkdT n=1 Tax=Pseudobacteroides cellulosolvens ATCC 35603 = DSM 2933 TaxID=398512 RepID=A0A0L6JH11_9FIRM|nr:putative phage tail protein [Pseudobacteroides cellulosolvens]KNY25013.1 Protein of unknown function DUF2313 [Pseudobacteroides cellulosolvens ATCC 35603 = DSM 2933]
MSVQYEKMKKYLPNEFNEILEIDSILQAESLEFEDINNSKQDIKNEMFIDSATDYGLNRWEKNILKISPKSGATLNDRRGTIKSYLIGLNKLNATRIQELAQAFNYGRINVELLDSKLIITFLDYYSPPSEYSNFYNYIITRKPAHLGLDIQFKTIDWNSVEYLNLTWNQIENLNLTWTEIEEGSWTNNV